MAGRVGVWEGTTTGGAESHRVIHATRSLANAESVGAAVVNDQFGDEDATVSAVASTARELFKVAGACESAGFAMSPAEFTFSAPVSPDSAKGEAAGPQIPDGFDDAGSGLGYRWLESPKCDYLRCTQLELFAYGTCPQSVYVRANTVDANGTIYGYANDLLGPMNAGDSAIATLTIAESAATATVITEVTCL